MKAPWLPRACEENGCSARGAAQGTRPHGRPPPPPPQQQQQHRQQHRRRGREDVGGGGGGERGGCRPEEEEDASTHAHTTEGQHHHRCGSNNPDTDTSKHNESSHTNSKITPRRTKHASRPRLAAAASHTGRKTFLLLAAAVLTAPSLDMDTAGPRDGTRTRWPANGEDRAGESPSSTAGGGRENRRGWAGVTLGFGALAAPCADDAEAGGGAAQQVVVSPDGDVDLLSIFACEGGEFEVSWSGEVFVPGTIYIGRGTTVRIVGDTDNDTTTATTSSSSSSSSSNNVTFVDENDRPQEWVEGLSSRLPPLPNGLSAAAVATAPASSSTTSSASASASATGTLPTTAPAASTGSPAVSGGEAASSPSSYAAEEEEAEPRRPAPIFFVDGGNLFLENLAVRGGYTANSTDSLVYDYTDAPGAAGAYNGSFLDAGVAAFTNASSVVVVSGGAVHAVDATVTAVGCEFEDNFAEMWGGAIFANGSSVVLRGSVFRRCQAGFQTFAADEGVESAGGGIGTEFTNILIDGCLFEKCYAGKKGGAMHQGVGQITIRDSVFFNNTAGSNNVEADEPLGEGGALSFTACWHSFDGQSACGANDTVFIENDTGRKGGAVVIGSGRNDSRIEFHGCTVDNSTTGLPIEDDPQGEGGAFAVAKRAILVLSGCLLRNNYCGKKGGVVTLSSGSDWDSPGGTLILRNSTFMDNLADLQNAGVINLSAFSEVLVEGDGNVFAGNKCGAEGAVFGATDDTRLVVEGGEFYGNEASDGGGVVWTKGELSILGGSFSANEASGGGVVFAGEDSTVTLTGGVFRSNEALDGGVVFVAEEGALVVEGGVYEGNLADNGGGVFHTQKDGHIDITGGVFANNEADFGGFLYKEGPGNATCTGAATSVTGHRGVDGGAIYAVKGARLEWSCDLVDNRALAGPAIYARDDTEVVLRGVQMCDNLVARGSVVFVVDSNFSTYQVVFNDTTGSEDLSAVQADQGSSYKAEDTSFVGFAGEAVVFSEGILYLDDCDFSGSSAAQLVEGAATTVVRNAVLGDNNYLSVADSFSRANLLPEADALINVNVTCDGGDIPLCSDGSPCIDGDLGVYCECYVRESTSEEMCVSGDPSLLSLRASATPNATFFPNLLEGDLVLTLEPSAAAATTTTSATSTATLSSSSSSSSSSAGDAAAGHGVDVVAGTAGGVVWNASGLVVSSVEGGTMEWTVFPAAGLLLPGRSVTLRVASLPGEGFDGDASVSFEADGMGSPALGTAAADGTGTTDGSGSGSGGDSGSGTGTGSDSASSGEAIAAQSLSSDGGAGGTGGPAASTFDVSFYHCIAGNFWNSNAKVGEASSCAADGEDTCCELCLDKVEGDDEGVDCQEPGATTRTLPIRQGYWRASVDSTFIRQCFNEDACQGGSAVMSSQEYCNSGYEGPQCAVCAPGYGRGVANSCHECTASFKGGMYFVMAVGLLLTIVVAVLLAVYLVGGRGAVSTTVTNTRESVRMLQRRGSFLIRADGERRLDIGVSGSGSGSKATAAASKDGGGGGGGSSSSSSRASRSNFMSLQPSWGGGRNKSGGAPQIGPAKTGTTAAAGTTPPTAAATTGTITTAAAGATRGTSSPTGSSTAADAPAAGGAVIEEPEARGVGDSTSGRSLPPSSAPAVRGDGLVRGGGGKGAGRRRGGDGGDGRGGEGDGKKRKKKTAAARIGEVLSGLPLSKLKIVVVVWQISSAFSEVTNVPFPPVYEKFLGIIGIFSFDLGWLMSAACLTAGIDFYDKLLMVTIGPVVLLLLLGFTFYLGARPVRKGRILINDSMRSGVTAGNSSRTVSFIGSRTGGGGGNTTSTGRSSSAAESGDSSGGGGGDASSGLVPVPPSTVSVSEGEGERPQRARPSARRVWRNGPGDESDVEQNHLWQLFARHTTMMLIILYLVYTQVSTVVFQAFACEDFDEIDKSYLRADFRIECDTPKHNAYKVYAAVMICIYPLGIPAAFCYFLVRQKSKINPPTDKGLKDRRGGQHVVREKMNLRRTDQAIAPTSFLWNAYYPNRYYYEVFECLRRLLLTGLLVFLVPDTAGQVAFGCVFAFLSLLVFELLRPHVDRLDMQLYRTGCLVIFFTNFLALMIKAEVASPNSRGSAVYSVVLIVVNVCFFLSIFCNAWAAAKASFSRRHVQDMMLGVDLLNEENVDKMLGPKKKKTNQEKLEEALGPNAGDVGDLAAAGDAKIEDLEAPPAWEADPDDPPDSPVDISSRIYRRDIGGGGGGGGGHSVASTVGIPSTFWGAPSHGGPSVGGGMASVSELDGPRDGGGGGGGGRYASAWGGDQGLTITASSVGGGGTIPEAPSPFGRGGNGGSIGGGNPAGRRSSASPAGAGPAVVPAFGGGDLAAFARRVVPTGGIPVTPPAGAIQRAPDAAAPTLVPEAE